MKIKKNDLTASAVWLLRYCFPRETVKPLSLETVKHKTSWTKAQENVLQRKSSSPKWRTRAFASLNYPFSGWCFAAILPFFPLEPLTSHHTVTPSNGALFQRPAWETDATVTHQPVPLSADICARSPASGKSQQLGLHPAITKEIARNKLLYGKT